ncbi:Terminase-like family protein [compost metagenome]
MALKIKQNEVKGKRKIVKSAKDTKLERYNEIMDDFELFCSEFVKIVDNHGELIPFILNKEQSDFVDTMDKFNIILKSRQIGFSTVSLAICLWNAINRPNSSYMIVSLDRKQVSYLFERLKLMSENLPRDKFEFPETVRDNKDELLLSNGSRIQVSPPQQNIGRGGTYQYILLSELAFYEVDQSKLLTSLTQALAKNPDSKIVIESTADGTGNYYYELFDKSFKKLTNYKAYFYSWISDAHKQNFKSEIDQAVEWYKSINKGRKMSTKDLYTSEEKRLYKAGATLPMMCWRQWKLSSMSMEDFQTEFPSTHTEAFKTSGRNVFDQGKILERLNNIPEPIDTETLRKELPETLHKWVGKGLSVYHLPRHGVRYYGGSDVASGSGGDSSSLTLMDKDGVEVASFHNNKISVYEFAEFLNNIGRYYGYAYLAIERNSYGLPVIQRLRENFRYMNLYKHRTFDKKGNKKLELGFLTTEVTKSIMISDLKEHFEKLLILVNDKETLQQMQMFIEDKNGKMGNRSGRSNHDDLVISLGLAIQARKSGKWYV